MSRYRWLFCLGGWLWCLSFPAAAAEMLRYAGATTLQRSFMPELARVLQAESGIRIVIAGGNTNPGIRALLAGEADLAGAGRALTAAERQQGLVEHFLGWDVLAIVVARNNPLTDLSLAQLRGIFAGEITNWQAVGGPNQPIVVVTAPPGAAMRTAVQELILKERLLTRQAVVSGVTAQADQQLATFPGGITAVSLSMVDARACKTLTVGGVAATAANVRARSYPLAKPLALITRGQPRGALAQLITLAESPRGQAILDKHFVATIKP